MVHLHGEQWKCADVRMLCVAHVLEALSRSDRGRARGYQRERRRGENLQMFTAPRCGMA